MGDTSGAKPSVGRTWHGGGKRGCGGRRAMWSSRKRQTQGLSVDGAAAGLAVGGSCGQEESWSTVTMCLSMRCDPIALAGRKAALEAALRKMATDSGGREFRVEWTRVGPSEDTLQRVLPLLLERVGAEGAALLFQVCKPLPSLPPHADAPLPSLPRTACPAHVFCWSG